MRDLFHRLRRLVRFRAHAVNLGVFRIAVFSAMAVESFVPANNARFFADVPRSLRVAAQACPPLNALPVSSAGATLVWYGMLFFCFLAAAGILVRISCPIATVLAFYVLGLPHLYWLSNHHHHLIWFGVLLSLSPCGDALRLFPRRGNRVPPTDLEGPAYGIPLAAAWVLIGIIYFFPGLWKMSLQFPEWTSGEKLRAILYNQWWIVGAPPLGFRPDLHPLLLRLCGMYVLLFEVGFLFALAFPVSRPFAVLGGILFHTLTFVVLRISFWPLVVCYVVFFDWASILEMPAAAAPGPSRRSLMPVKVAAAVLIAGNVFCGVFRIDAWPFAVYPTFLRPYELVAYSLDFVAHDDQGAVLSTDAAVNAVSRRFGRVRWARLCEYIAHDAGPGRSGEMALGLWTVLRRQDPALERASRLEVFGTTADLRPGPQPKERQGVLFSGKI